MRTPTSASKISYSYTINERVQKILFFRPKFPMPSDLLAIK